MESHASVLPVSVARVGRCGIWRRRASVPARLKMSCGDARPTRATKRDCTRPDGGGIFGLDAGRAGNRLDKLGVG